MKTFALAITVALSLLQVSFAAPAIKARDCQTIPSTANAAVRDQVYRITQSRGVTAKVLLSTFESVQRSEFPDRYDQAQGIAQDLINQARASVGGGGSNPGTGKCAGVAAYGAATVYTGGQKCTYGGHLWTAKWWTQYETPSTGGSGVWQDDGAC
ncbi:hypothetical protein FRC11_011089 [Ceratobasidium sp. 423]|nr:hypothetical protein FRC11_011089 [Ceratobasidium sp. 423]